VTGRELLVIVINSYSVPSCFDWVRGSNLACNIPWERSVSMQFFSF
jgi:hypothetical protein